MVDVSKDPDHMINMSNTSTVIKDVDTETTFAGGVGAMLGGVREQINLLGDPASQIQITALFAKLNEARFHMAAAILTNTPVGVALSTPITAEMAKHMAGLEPVVVERSGEHLRPDPMKPRK